MTAVRKFSQLITTMLLLSPVPLGATTTKQDVNQIGQRNVARRSIMSHGMETWMGKRAANRLERSSKFVQDPELTAYVDRIAKKVAGSSDLKIQVSAKVIDAAEFDASSLPGGYLYVTTGLLESLDNEGELAAVISHEIAHLAARHGANHVTKRVAMLGAGFLPFGTTFLIASWASQPFTPLALAKFSRGQELEADFLGVQYLYKAGYNPSSFISLLQKIQELEHSASNKASNRRSVFAKYPRSEERIERVKREIHEILPEGKYSAPATSEFESLRNRLLAGRIPGQAGAQPGFRTERHSSEARNHAEIPPTDAGLGNHPPVPLQDETAISFTPPVLQHND